MPRTLIVPAAGSGARLGLPAPKLLVPVAGRPMIDHVLERYAPWVERTVIVVNPTFAATVERHCAARGHSVELAFQSAPTGMLDAILIAAPVVGRLDSAVWVTWCDQVAVRTETPARLARACEADPEAALVLPTAERRDPYVHFVRDARGEIEAVLQRREGDPMPRRGESDLGLFALSPWAYGELLPRFAREVPAGAATGERNFLLFIPWLRGRARVVSVPGGAEIETLGVNTPDDLAVVEAHLARS